MIRLFPASKFVATAATASFPTQVGRTIYAKVSRPATPGTLGSELTWRTCRGVMVWLWGRWCFYVPLFFWRDLV